VFSRQQQSAHAVRRLAGQGGHDVAVEVHRRAHLAVAEQLHHDPRVHVLAQQDSGRGVPAVMQADVADAGRSQQARTS
jgi:hypothetical protein